MELDPSVEPQPSLIQLQVKNLFKRTRCLHRPHIQHDLQLTSFCNPPL